MKKYKIAIYAICKNEEKFVEKWIESMSEADYICVLDTGSTDNTYNLLLKYQNDNPSKYIISQKVITPWRFDVARNESMKLIPKDADILMCTDLDELLEKGWADVFRENWNPELKKMFYKYSWSHTKDGRPGRVFWYDKCHSNNDEWFWQFPVHETLTYKGQSSSFKAKYLPEDTIWLHHWPDTSKSRSSYLPLLEKRAEEYPQDFYGLVYLAHEYTYRGMYQKSIDFIENKVLPSIPDWDDMLCKTDLYLFLGDNYRMLKNYKKSEENYKLGIASAPLFRENYLQLAQLYLELNKYQDAINIVNECLLKTKRFYSWLERDISWTFQPYDILSLAYFYNGQKEVALEYAKLAALLDTNVERLQNNVKIIEKFI